METLLQHRSIRKFTDKAIAEEDLDLILRAAAQASNTGNMQWYSIIVTTNPALKHALCAQAHFNQNMVEQAPVLLTFCADLQRFTQWCELNNAKPEYNNFLSFYTATIDAAIAAQNACVAAEKLGLGICYLGTTNYNAQQIIDILELPALVVPVTTVVLGYAAEEAPLTGRLPQRAVVHREHYQPFSDAEIRELYAEREKESQQFVVDNAVENLAQVFTKKRYAGANNRTFTQKLLDVIAKQGF
ncbi:MAG: nitroreductase family protein [Bacteroidales bacterium]|jgi:nitroreductase|nr:nitroreductase family protein [Bacteroidales bacterium]